MKKITILIRDEQHRRIQEIAVQREVMMSEQIRIAIDRYLSDVDQYAQDFEMKQETSE